MSFIVSLRFFLSFNIMKCTFKEHLIFYFTGNIYGKYYYYICLFPVQVLVPSKELVLAGKDAAAEYDELAEPQDFQDDPEWVIDTDLSHTHTHTKSMQNPQTYLCPFSPASLPSGSPTRLVSSSKWSLWKKRTRMSPFHLGCATTSITSHLPSGRARRGGTLLTRPFGSLIM